MSIEFLFATAKLLVILYFMTIGWSIASSLRRIAAVQSARAAGRES